MNSLAYTFLKPCNRFSLCDIEIDAIICEENVVKFVFSNGFYIIDNDKTQLTKTGVVEFSHGGEDEFCCHVIKRKISNKGSILCGSPISLSELSAMLSKDGRRIELFQELYDFNNLLWRGVLLPYNPDGLSDHVVIETSDCFPITFFWE